MIFVKAVSLTSPPFSCPDKMRPDIFYSPNKEELHRNKLLLHV